MKVKNNSNRLICLQTKEGRVDLLPAAVTDDKRIDLIEDEKLFKILIESGDLETVTSAPEKKKTPKELLVEEATELGIDTTDMTVSDLEAAIEEALT